jgi:hypothetical protein
MCWTLLRDAIGQRMRDAGVDRTRELLGSIDRWRYN